MNNNADLLRHSCLFAFLTILTLINPVSANETSDSNSNLSIELAKQEALANTKYLLGNVLQKSKSLQETHGDFAPYGAALFKGGEVKYVWHTKPGKMTNEPAFSLPVLRQVLKSQAQSGKIVSSAVIYKYQKKGIKKSQLTIELEYQTGFAQGFSTEMIIDKNNKVSWGNNKQVPIEPKVFALE